MEDVDMLSFNNIARFLSEKDILNLCRTNSKMMNKCNKNIFLEKYFGRFLKIDAEEFGLTHFELISLMIDGCGDLYRGRFYPYNPIVVGYKLVQKNICKIIDLGGDETYIDSKNVYTCSFYKKNSTLLKKYFLSSGSAKNVLDVASDSDIGWILSVDHNLYEVQKVKKTKSLPEELDLGIKIVSDEYELVKIKENIKQIGCHYGDSYYITINNKLYFNNKEIASDVKFAKYYNNLYFVSFENITYKLNDEEKIEKIIESDYEIINLTQSSNKPESLLVHLANGAVMNIKGDDISLYKEDIIKLINSSLFINSKLELIYKNEFIIATNVIDAAIISDFLFCIVLPLK